MDAELKEYLDTMRREMREENTSMFEAMRQENAANLEAMRQENAANLEAMRQENVAQHAETRRHSEVVGEHLRSEIQQVAEGVMMVGERVDRLERRVTGVEARLDRLTLEVRLGFSEVRSSMRDSYDALDRRVSALEDNGR